MGCGVRGRRNPSPATGLDAVTAPALRILALRAGYYQGTLSAGMGAHLFFLDLNAAMYVRREDRTIPWNIKNLLGNLGDSGLTVELALRL